MGACVLFNVTLHAQKGKTLYHADASTSIWKWKQLWLSMATLVFEGQIINVNKYSKLLYTIENKAYDQTLFTKTHKELFTYLIME